jgi:hypothetical protein
MAIIRAVMVLFTYSKNYDDVMMKKESPAGVAGDNNDLSYSLIQVKPKPYQGQNCDFIMKF